MLKTGPMRDVLAVMNECTAHILTTWGLDPDKLANASRGVRLMDPQTLSRRILETYPTRALQNNEQGRVGVLVKIDEKGGVYDCEIVADSGSKSLNNAACNGMKRAKFEPALDVAGQPIKSYYSTRISYRLN